MTESFDDAQVPVLEHDETIPPRPEEEVADVARSTPDRAGHGGEVAAGGDGDALDAGSGATPGAGRVAREIP